MREGSLFNHPDYYVKAGLFPAVALVVVGTFIKPASMWPHILLVIAIAWTFISGLARGHDRSHTAEHIARLEKISVIGANALAGLAVILALLA